MPAQIIDGKALAAARLSAVRTRAAALAAQGRTPCLAAVTVSADAGWTVYCRNQATACAAAGIAYRVETLPSGADQHDLIELIEGLNADPAVHGILVQAPLPAPFDLVQAQGLIGPGKDVEGVNPANLGLLLAGRPGFAPCTACSGFALAEQGFAQLGKNLRGAEAVVVGASVIVGRPLAQLLIRAGATVTLCHIDTRDCATHTRSADLVVVAVGKPGLLTAAMLGPGSVVVDVGINQVPAGKKWKVVGDAAADVWDVAAAVTPVPGGVGSVTTAILLEHVVEAAERQARERPALDGAALARILGPVAADMPAGLTERVAGLLSRHLVAGGLAPAKPALQRLLDRGLVLLDGAMGTELIARGVPSSAVAAANLNQPDLVHAVHRAYVDAGAQVLTANTFTLNRYTVADRQALAQQLAAGVRLARQAAAGRALVLGSLGPLPRIIGAELTEAEAIDAYAEVALALADAGVDGFLAETLSSTTEAVAAIQGCRRASALPVLVSRCAETEDAAELAEFARAAAAAGASAVGLNCAGGPRAMLPALRTLLAVADLPVLARPNAGHPRLVDGSLLYDLRPEWLAAHAETYRSLGARLIGGCCGVGPAHLAAVVKAISGRPAVAPVKDASAAMAARPAAAVVQAVAGFRRWALVAGRVGLPATRSAAVELARAGAGAIGIDQGWPGSPSATGLPSRLRHLQDQAGAPTILSLSAASLSAAEAQAVLLSAHLLGIRHLLIDGGIFGGGGSARALPPAKLVALAAAMNAGRDLRGSRLPEPTSFQIGVRLPLEQALDPAAVDAYAAAGAACATVQPVYEPDRFRAALAAVAPRLPLLAEVLVLPDADTAEELDNEVPALSVPPRLKELLAADPERDQRGVLRFLGHWRARLAGVVVLLPDGRSGPAAAVLRGLG